MTSSKRSGLLWLMTLVLASVCVPASVAQNSPTNPGPAALHLGLTPQALRVPTEVSPGEITDSVIGPDDWDLAGRVRAALLTDPELSRHNLIVVVRGGVVELDGPVPSNSLRERVLQVVRSVPGVKQLRDRLRIQAESWSSRAFRRHLPPVDEPWRNDLAGLSPATEGLRFSPWPTRASASTGAVPSPVSAVPQSEPGPTSAEGVRVPVLLPPQADSLAEATLTWPVAPPAQLATQVVLEQLLRRQWRYRRVQFELQGTTLVLLGSVESLEDWQELLRALSRLPGITAIRTEGLKIMPAGAAQ